MKKPEEYLIPRVLKNWGTDLESIKESIKPTFIEIKKTVDLIKSLSLRKVRVKNKRLSELKE